jgi:DNA-directed RNA polymerase subunit RPC12/RpoP
MSEWYTLDNGQQRGPFTQATLSGLVASGQLKATDMVRHKEASTWAPATSIAGLFPGQPASAAAPQVTATPSVPPPAPIATMPLWHYSVNGKQCAPVSEESLKQLAITGQLRRTDLVWKAGMPSWAPAGNVREIFAPAAPPSAPGISIACATCGRWLQFAAEYIGTMTQCPYCQTPVLVRAPARADASQILCVSCT